MQNEQAICLCRFAFRFFFVSLQRVEKYRKTIFNGIVA